MRRKGNPRALLVGKQTGAKNMEIIWRFLETPTPSWSSPSPHNWLLSGPAFWPGVRAGLLLCCFHQLLGDKQEAGSHTMKTEEYLPLESLKAIFQLYNIATIFKRLDNALKHTILRHAPKNNIYTVYSVN